MATRVDLPIAITKRALHKEKQSLERTMKASDNPIIKDALSKEWEAVNTAFNTVTEIK